MGTNFYKVLPVSEVELQELDNVLSDIKSEILETGKVSWELQDRLDKLQNKRVHLGKRSSGWQFLWNHNNGEYYDLTFESIKEFLNKPGLIINEYGEEFTVEQFLENEIKVFLWGDHEVHRYTSKTYRRDHPDEWYDVKSITVNIRGKEYTSTYSDILNDGLRFSTSTDFC